MAKILIATTVPYTRCMSIRSNRKTDSFPANRGLSQFICEQAQSCHLSMYTVPTQPPVLALQAATLLLNLCASAHK